MAAIPSNDKDLDLNSPVNPETADEQRKRLRQLIALGKERGYLTYSEINDHLPDDVSDAEQIENIVSMIAGLGIQVCDEAPDAEQLLMSDATPAVADEDAVEEAEAALSTVDAEFGRTTDPVRMYMREMGTVELLTREGEIEIAKRIEEGLKHMIMAISACPGTLAQVLELVNRIERDELRVDEVVDGFVDPNAEVNEESEFTEPPEADPEADELAVDEEDEDEEGNAAAVSNANLEELKQQTIEHFTTIRALYDQLLAALRQHGSMKAVDSTRTSLKGS